MSITCVRTYTVLRRGTRRRTIRTNTGSHHGSVHALTYPRHHHSSPPFCTVRRNAPTRRPSSSSYSRASHAMPCMRDAAAHHHHHHTTSVARGGADCRRPEPEGGGLFQVAGKGRQGYIRWSRSSLCGPNRRRLFLSSSTCMVHAYAYVRTVPTYVREGNE